ncbi:MAG: SH3 domain-containing protein [Bacilli bacterium]|nr:SH3 domain-containing protein [Bacilli bacterium]
MKLKKVVILILGLTLITYSLIGRISFSYAKSYAAKITGNAVALRDKPTTKNSTRIDTLNSGDTISIIDDNKIYDKDNNDCSDGWVKVSFNNKEGYLCSSYYSTDISDVYLRPWNTPKKAIVGGAKFIGNAYISKGQFTSYLKKFNVNPNGSYDIYKHLYQTNIQAPSSEAITSWKSYNNNNSIDLAFNFNIPIYENMKATYSKPDGKQDANLSKLNKVKDKEFEETIKDFPDSYKPYLRQLHSIHPSWTFTAMKTGLDFETAATNFMLSGSINSTNKKLVELDSKGRLMATNEKGWYYPNLATTKYYLDPRNWLNETFVFMFENLSYIEVSEKLIQSVLNKNELISGFDAIDNQTYASIFLEAGKTANVNSVYLASLAIQEIGSQSLLVSGKKFTYNGIEYDGLYNFFNIGAFSSASNPLRAGLVYASGGLCTSCSSFSLTENSTPVENKQDQKEESTKEDTTDNSKTKEDIGDIKNIGGIISGKYVKGIDLGTTVESIKNKDKNISYDSNDTIKTGTKISLKDGTSYTVVMYGDLSGDGLIDSLDLLKLRKHLLGTSKLSGAYLEAAKIEGSNSVDSLSLLRIRKHLLGTKLIKQG